MEEFRTRLKALRKSRGLSQQTVADHIGITKSAYGYYESGATLPNIKTFCIMLDYYGVEADYLLGRKGE